MRIHEYQSRQLLADAGVPVPPAEVVESVDQAAGAGRRIGGRLVVKAQVLAGGRGKAGFVRLCETADQVREAAGFMLGRRMVSPQTGPAGVPVKKLLVASAVEIDREYYLGVTIDRSRRCPVLMASRHGGVEIEETAARDPRAIHKEWLHPHLGLQPFQIRRVTKVLGLTVPAEVKALAATLRGMVDVFLRCDASLVEINPLVVTRSGELMAIDAKITFDDNGLFRHPEIARLHDEAEENPAEVRARAAGLSYIAMDGNIGCIVNGAGLAMATMDLIKHHGGEPANFLDVGGGVTAEGALEAFRIVLAEEKVKGVLVNIFGGIARCDLIAGAIIAAACEVGFRVPVVVRLEGTNVDIARKMLEEGAIPKLVTAVDLTDAARKACTLVTGSNDHS
jgi:succinyl-CoA synthetase beta subunit